MRIHLPNRPTPCYFLTIVLGFLALCASGKAGAQWASDSVTNTPVCDTIHDQVHPEGCTDGSNGAIFVWEDLRSGTPQLYAQHLNASGSATWKRNGVKLASIQRGTYSQTGAVITTDDSGGAYIVWEDGRFTNQSGNCIFAQHLLANGSIAYPDSGLPVAIGINGCNNPVLCDDGHGNAYVAWEDNRAFAIGTRPDIWMNRLWPGGIKYGLVTVGTQGTMSIDFDWNTLKYDTTFHDANAHFASYLVNQYITIGTKGSYLIGTVLNDTQLILHTHPPIGTYSYFIPGLMGLPLDTFQGHQSGLSIQNDGSGGFFLAWTSSGTIPNSIFATRVDSTGTALWDPMPNPGFLIYKGYLSANLSRNVSICRDSNQLLLAWEVFNSNNQSWEVYAQRMRCQNLRDTAFTWGSPLDVSSDQINDQTMPQIFGDDSTVLGVRGALIPFLDAQPGSTDNIDIAVERIQGDGGTLVPPAGNGFWFLEQKPHTQNGLRAVKIADPSSGGIHTGILAVWNDSWDGDTTVYAQRIDRNGQKYFPTIGTTNKWGQAISGDSTPSRRWTAKQVCLVPRANGGIAAWADNRNGNFDIYAQLLFRDGSLPIELASFTATCEHPGQVVLAWKTASEYSNAGFEIERRVAEDGADNPYSVVASYATNDALLGAGTSGSEHDYAWIDRGVPAAVYDYRLVEVSRDGSLQEHQPVRVDARYGARLNAWSFGPNQPNPFYLRTTIPLSLPTDAVVNLTICDNTGREIATPVGGELLSSGVHELQIGSASVPTPGAYFVRATAFDPVTGGLLWRGTLPLIRLAP